MQFSMEKAIAFRQFHRLGVLVLPNAWDVASARIFEEARFPAIATTSAGIAFSLGYPDGQRISREEMIARISRIVRAVNVPVTADIEGGYGSTPEEVVRTTRELIDAGAVGMNLEDTTGRAEQPLLKLEDAVEKIKAVKETAAQTRAPLFINARTDIYLLPGGEAEADYQKAVRRLVAYRDAGADCVFAPGLKDAETIGRLAKAVQCPLNILAVPGTPPISELARLGVARVSVGSGFMRATLTALRRMAEELKNSARRLRDEKLAATRFSEGAPRKRIA